MVNKPVNGLTKPLFYVMLLGQDEVNNLIKMHLESGSTCNHVRTIDARLGKMPLGRLFLIILLASSVWAADKKPLSDYQLPSQSELQAMLQRAVNQEPAVFGDVKRLTSQDTWVLHEHGPNFVESAHPQLVGLLYHIPVASKKKRSWYQPYQHGKILGITNAWSIAYPPDVSYSQTGEVSYDHFTEKVTVKPTKPTRNPTYYDDGYIPALYLDSGVSHYSSVSLKLSSLAVGEAPGKDSITLRIKRKPVTLKYAFIN